MSDWINFEGSIKTDGSFSIQKAFNVFFDRYDCSISVDRISINESKFEGTIEGCGSEYAIRLSEFKKEVMQNRAVKRLDIFITQLYI